MPMSHGERILSRAQTIMASGTARSWSHAIQRAAELTGEPPTAETWVGEEPIAEWPSEAESSSEEESA